jgi:hypothetical protein
VTDHVPLVGVALARHPTSRYISILGTGAVGPRTAAAGGGPARRSLPVGGGIVGLGGDTGHCLLACMPTLYGLTLPIGVRIGGWTLAVSGLSVLSVRYDGR